MAKPIEIQIPDQASATASASIPAASVPEVAQAMRGVRPQGDDESDEVYVANCMVEYARETVQQYRRHARIIAAAQEDEPAPF